jgi:hypothetical protein
MYRYAVCVMYAVYAMHGFGHRLLLSRCVRSVQSLLLPGKSP